MLFFHVLSNAGEITSFNGQCHFFIYDCETSDPDPEEFMEIRIYTVLGTSVADPDQ
jgi:hypothetical protein